MQPRKLYMQLESMKFHMGVAMQVGTLEATKVKILLMGEDSNPQSIRLELASEGDLFFHYMHVCDEGSFQLIQVRNFSLTGIVNNQLPQH